MESTAALATLPGAGSRPTLPTDEVPLTPEAVRGLRRFHLGGDGSRLSGGTSGETPGGTSGETPGKTSGETFPVGTVPALFSPFRNGARLRTDFPLFLGPPPGGMEAGEATLCLSPRELLGRAARQAGLDSGLLADNLPRLERGLAAAVEGDSEGDSLAAPAPARPFLAQVGQAMVEALGLEANPRQRLEGELARLVAAVPEGGSWIPRGEAALLHLLRGALLERYGPAWKRLRAEAQGLEERLAALLAEDRRHRTPASGEAVGARDADDLGSLGGLGSRFVDGGALRSQLSGSSARQSSGGLDPARRRRLSEAHATLADCGAPPLPLLVQTTDGPGDGPAEGSGDGSVAGLDGWRTVVAADPCAAAAERFDAEARELARLLRAVRVARLELAGDFEEEVHGPWLERFDWRAFSDEEALLLPPVVAWATGADLGDGMVSLSRLLLSGRPVQVLAMVSPTESTESTDSTDSTESIESTESIDSSAALTHFHFELAYLGISHREALVQQTLALRPLHAMAGFRRAAASHRTALHVIAGPAAGNGAGLDPWLLAGAALDGRAHPLFLYDPEAGSTWARRMDFTGNPAPEEDWPVYDLEVATPTGGGEVLKLAFTFADFALLEAAYRGCFRLLPPGAVPKGGQDGTALVPLADWLALEDAEAMRRIPFVWVVADDGILRRAVVSRPLAAACQDRLDYWRTLQELAGARNEYAERAAQEARREERERLEAQHRQELARLEREVAERLADRLTAALLEIGTGAGDAVLPEIPKIAAPLATPGDAPPSPPPETAKAAEAPAAAAQPMAAPSSEASPATVAMDPYIDTALCTSCNECTQINPKMFAYDDNKQAYIADPTAGTFQELVKAAERCTARIIHPGTPLNPQEPGLDEWLHRAQPFQ
jgi:ferredoxin